jgi:hypothetical protein
VLISVSLAGFLYACGEQSPDAAAQAPMSSPATLPSDVTGSAAVTAGTLERGVYFQPELEGYALHNEYDDDGDGDGVNETHVRRYINSTGDTAFSMNTGGEVWAWSLDTKGDDDSDIHKNYVVRDSNCDKVFDERYSLDAQFHVPACLEQGGAADKPASVQ